MATTAAVDFSIPPPAGPPPWRAADIPPPATHRRSADELAVMRDIRPSIGEWCLILNGFDYPAPAVITRVWGLPTDPTPAINVTAFPDGRMPEFHVRVPHVTRKPDDNACWEFSK